jgi:hypothetical protein
MSNHPRLLLPQHRADLERSGLSADQIAACGFYSISDPRRVAELLGWKRPAAQLGSCLAIPFRDAAGVVNGFVRLKPDKPRASNKDGKPCKYESPRGKPNRAYFPPGTVSVLTDPSVPLILTEGEKKSAKADQDGFPCVGLVGVYGFQRRRLQGELDGSRHLIDDLAGVAWKGRTVYVVYDSDAADKPELRWAEWHLAHTLAGQGATMKVVRLPGGPPGPDGKAGKVGLDDFLVAQGPDALRRLLASAAEAAPPEDRRPEVVESTQEHLTIDRAVRALAAGDPGLFQRGGQLVRVAQPSRPPAGRLLTGGGPKVEPVPEADLRTRLTRCAQILKVSKTKKGSVKRLSHPPKWLVPGIAGLGSWPGIAHLEAVVAAPVLRPDGSILQRAGYDAATGLLLEPDCHYPPVPEHPTRGDAVRACAALEEAVCDFPFAGPEQRAAWLAAVLTLVARFAFDGPAPLFLFEANCRGTGKGLLADVTAMIGTGGPFARSPYTTNDDEMRKVITSAALQGERALLFDNVASSLGSASLDAALTSTEWRDRLLGKNQSPRLPLFTVFFATGNNLIVLADTARRTVCIRLETAEEKPEERTDFVHPDLLAWVRRERGRMLAAALTVLSGYVRAGRPDQHLAAWGSYEAWSELVRGALVWAGQPDPGLTRQGFAGRADVEANALRGFVSGWKELTAGGHRLTAAQAVEKFKADPARYPVLGQAFAEAFDLAPGEPPTPRKLGNRLRKYKGRTVGGECIDNDDAHNGVFAWFVRRSRPAPGGCGGCGGSTSAPFAHAENFERTKRVDGGPETSTTSTTSTTPAPDAWDPDAADRALAAVHARCNYALGSGEASGPARQAVLEVSRGLAVQHHRDRDPLLFQDLEELEALITRWKQEV